MIPAPSKKSGRLDEDEDEDDDFVDPGTGMEKWRAEQDVERERRNEGGICVCV